MLDLAVSADETHLADLLEPGGEARSGGTDLLEPGGAEARSGGTDLLEPGDEARSGGTDLLEPGDGAGLES